MTKYSIKITENSIEWLKNSSEEDQYSIFILSLWSISGLSLKQRISVIIQILLGERFFLKGLNLKIKTRKGVNNET